MRERTFGSILLTAALLAAGLAGVVACWSFWPRTSNTSPLAALLTLLWSCTYIGSAILTWRRSRLAGTGLLAAMGLLVPLFWFVFPGNVVLFLPLSGFTFLFALLGYRYLTKAREAGA